jgi:hypothetical protein
VSTVKYGTDEVRLKQWRFSMTETEFKTKRAELKREYHAQLVRLSSDYAFSNNPHKIGDIISDETGPIEIEVIRWVTVLESDFPQCIYTGKDLRSSAEAGTKRSIAQNNIKE